MLDMINSHQMKPLILLLLFVLPITVVSSGADEISLSSVYHNSPNIITEPTTITIETPSNDIRNSMPVVREPKGKWITVIATAYSPKDTIDSHHKNCQDDFTANMNKLSTHPYGIAIPMAKNPEGRSCVPVIASYGQLIYIPIGYGYLDKSRRTNRVFEADDTGGTINTKTRETGTPHIDLRFQDESSAKKFGKKEILIFVFDIPEIDRSNNL